MCSHLNPKARVSRLLVVLRQYSPPEVLHQYDEYGRQKRGSLAVQALTPGPVSMQPYMAKGALLLRLRA